jgi:hypothetical protein
VKFLLSFALLFASASASAETLIECRNQNTGAAITVSREHSGVAYVMNSDLLRNLASQGALAARATGFGQWLNRGGIYFEGGLYFLAGIAGEFEFGLYTHGFGYVLRGQSWGVQDSEPRPTVFYFNPGECR